MFTGIIERSASLTQVTVQPGYRRLRIASPNDGDWSTVRLGESIAINGVCLTVADIGHVDIGFDVIPETLAKTNLGRLVPGAAVNVERALRVGDRIDGHFVQGHVDGTAPIIEQRTTGGEWRLVAEVPQAMAIYLAPKGSICLDGVSLTLAKIEGRRFEVALIPTTLQITTLGKLPVGWPLNIEADIFSKTIVNWLEQRRDWVENQVK